MLRGRGGRESRGWERERERDGGEIKRESKEKKIRRRARRECPVLANGGIEMVLVEFFFYF